ncbi:MAG TPA: hypothetical protein DCW97_06725 [Acidobacteria bacterium]|nr:hypothetical protein [Acidobacteriota bacterium]
MGFPVLFLSILLFFSSALCFYLKKILLRRASVNCQPEKPPAGTGAQKPGRPRSTARGTGQPYRTGWKTDSLIRTPGHCQTYFLAASRIASSSRSTSSKVL